MIDVTRLFGEQADAYAHFRPRYPDTLFDWLQTNAPSHTRALDVACGTGQASTPLRERFSQVLACDTSLELLAGKHFPRQIARIACDARDLPFVDDCLDLIVVAQALHWFSGPQFFREVTRTLRQDGLFCAWCYGLAQVSPAIDELVAYLHGSLVADYWPAGRASVDLGYSDIELPMPAVTTPPEQIRLQWSLEQFLGYLDTWSAVRTCRELTRTDPLHLLHTDLQRAWGDPERTRPIRWPLHIIAGRNR